MRGVLVSLATVLLATLAADGYRVLVVFPLPVGSHGILGEGYVRELLKKGHQVTYITPHHRKEQHGNLTQVVATSYLDLFPANLMDVSKILDNKLQIEDFGMMLGLMQSATKRILQDETIRQFLLDPKQQFDVVVAEWMFSDLYAGFAALYQCPLVWSSSMDAHSLVLRLVDEVSNPSYTADALSHNTLPFSFLERVNELWMLMKRLYYYESSIPKVAADYMEVFSPAAQKRGVALPPYEEIIYNGSLILANAHPSLGDAPKLPQNVRHIGGYHVERVVKPLPSDLQQIMDGAKNGVIYFSLGSNMKSKDIPIKIQKGLLDMFSKLKQTVLWKFEADMDKLPKNVHIIKWAPQSAILAHPNTKLFITHGGLLSTTEVIHYGVPIVGIPLFADQFVNVGRAVKKGFGVGVSFTWNLVEDLKAAIEKVVNNPSYADRVRQLSALYHDRPLAPADELVYWVEHTARTRGAPHLRSAALLLPWYRRLYVDLLALLVTALLGTVLLIKSLLRLWRGPQHPKTKTN